MLLEPDSMRRKSASDPEKLSASTSDTLASPPNYLSAWVTRPGSHSKRRSDASHGHTRRSGSVASRGSTRSLQPSLSRMIANSFQHDSLTACCVANDHLLTRSAEPTVSYQATSPYGILGESAVNVDISDFNGDEDAVLLTQCLNYCHKVVLKPLTLLLLLMGWRPFRYGALVRYPCIWKTVNKVYPLLVFILMVFYDAMLITTCECKLQVYFANRTDCRAIAATAVHPLPLERENRMYNNSFNNTPMHVSTVGSLLSKLSVDVERSPNNCNHIIPIYVVPAILHMVAFIYGFFHYRIQEHEQIYSLMEKVFIRSQTSWGVQLTLLKNSRFLLCTVLLWMALNISLEVLYNIAFTPEVDIFKYTFHGPHALGISLYVIRCLGLLLLMIMHVVVLFNYSSQCEMLIMYINGLVMCLREKSLLLKEAMHEILGVREYITVLNGALGKITAVCLVNYFQLVIIGLFFLNPFPHESSPNDREWDALKWTYRVAYPLVWLFSIAVPLIQGARMTKAGQKVRQVSFEMKVFGYHNSNNLELDSFVLFVNNVALRAKLFGVTIRPVVILLVLGGTVVCVVFFLVYECTSTKTYASLF